MTIDYKGVADEFFVNLNVQTTMALPNGRETILHFCEAAQKEFPDMAGFFQRESGEYVLEGDRDSGSYRWMEIHNHRLCGGYFNPPDISEAYRLHRWLLDRSVYYLGVSGLDIEAMDVLCGFNLDFQGNRDSVVANALLSGSPLAALIGDGGGTAIEFEPSLVVALDAECYMQARLSIETHCNSYQVRTGNYDEEPISVYFTIRGYPRPGKVMDFQKSFGAQTEACEDLLGRLVIPNVIQPIAAAIAAGS
ncbi:MAG: hypothetical protein HZA50_06505 [Planctomycetes bacterium]|nr:hypothetical protein [Planctomycetota bacterium]